MSSRTRTVPCGRPDIHPSHCMYAPAMYLSYQIVEEMNFINPSQYSDQRQTPVNEVSFSAAITMNIPFLFSKRALQIGDSKSLTNARSTKNRSNTLIHINRSTH
jgi:hypothetical protein